MNEDNGSAEQQAERMHERATQASRTSLSERRRERDGRGERDLESAAARLVQAGRRLLEGPGSGDRGHRAARRERGADRGAGGARAACAARLAPVRARGGGGVARASTRGEAAGIAVLTGLAAMALAGAAWTRIDAIERPQQRVDLR